MAEHPFRVTVKRSYSSTSDYSSRKRQRVHHSLRYLQRTPQQTEPAPQDALFAQGQLLRSISAALAIAGFDSVQESALEMLRAQAEEYIFECASHIRNSMHVGRRVKPAAQDFSAALARTSKTQTASLLTPQLSLKLPEDISCLTVPQSEPLSAAPPDFSVLLQPLMTSNGPSYIPRHFPPLPPQHAWKQTPVYPARERDARKMREKATEEGMLAEQALRKLAAAGKAGKAKEERRSSITLSGTGKVRDGAQKHKHKRDQDDSFADALNEIRGSHNALELDLERTNEACSDGENVGMPDGVLVNAELDLWRRSGGRKGLRV